METKEQDNLTKKTSDYQKRINELVFKQKEAERREQAALKYAKGLKKKYDNLEKASEDKIKTSSFSKFIFSDLKLSLLCKV